MSFKYKTLTLIIIFKIFFINLSVAENSNENFEEWLSKYKKFALTKGVSQKTIDISFKNVKFLDQVIKYDRKQPEFIEDTITYVNKRANSLREKNALKFKVNKLSIV